MHVHNNSLLHLCLINLLSLSVSLSLQQLPEYVRAPLSCSIIIDYRDLALEADKIFLTGREKHLQDVNSTTSTPSKTLLPMMGVGIIVPLATKPKNAPRHAKTITCSSRIRETPRRANSKFSFFCWSTS